ncbi:MAG: hypothetical protein FWE87_06200 [Coriobacteriia bacterium]|nr:hypothetical protein [Coriobacteriia bacterium]
MRIIDADAKQAMKHVILYLTPQEAGELRDFTDALLRDDAYLAYGAHDHVYDEHYEHEITLIVHGKDSIDKSLDDQFQKIILEDE